MKARRVHHLPQIAFGPQQPRSLLAGLEDLGLEAEGEGVQGAAEEAVAHQALLPEAFGEGERLVDHCRTGFVGGNPGAGHARPAQHLGPLGCLAVAEGGQPALGAGRGPPGRD